MGSILSQDDYWFTPRMPEKSVNLVIETLCKDSMAGTWDYPTNIKDGLKNAKNNLRQQFGVHYADVEHGMTLELLNERYVVWKKLMAADGVMINKWTKRVTTLPHVWERLVKEDPRVKWYGSEPEKAWDDLEVIFDNPWKERDAYVPLGNIGLLVDDVKSLDEFVVEPMPVTETPPRGYAHIDMPFYSPAVDAYAQNDVMLTPNPRGTPGLLEITKEAYEKSAKSSKYKKKLLFVPDSPVSSTGSTSTPIASKSKTTQILSKFNKSG